MIPENNVGRLLISLPTFLCRHVLRDAGGAEHITDADHVAARRIGDKHMGIHMMPTDISGVSSHDTADT